MFKTSVFRRVSLTVAMLAAIGSGGCGEDNSEVERFAQSLKGARVTVYPAVVRSLGGTNVSHDANAAAAIAASLKMAGVKEVLVQSESPALSSKTSFNQAAMFRASREAFSEYVKAHPPGTEYAAIAEYLTGGNGAVGGIHLYVVRRDGSPVYGTLLNSHHREFQAVHPRSNNQATAVLQARLKNDLHL